MYIGGYSNCKTGVRWHMLLSIGTNQEAAAMATDTSLIPYSGKFSHGANFRILRGMLVNRENKNREISTKEL